MHTVFTFSQSVSSRQNFTYIFQPQWNTEVPRTASDVLQVIGGVFGPQHLWGGADGLYDVSQQYRL